MIIWVLSAPSLLAHLIDTVLWRYVGNTLILMSGVGLLACLFGISSAWVVAAMTLKGA